MATLNMTYPNESPIAIIQLGEPPAEVKDAIGEQHHWFIRALNLSAEKYRLIRPDLGQMLPNETEISGAILTGSWAMVTSQADWSEAAAAWIRDAYQRALPLFGVCYGHQLMAHALGGVVEDNPCGWEGGLQWVNMSKDAADDALLCGLPERFSAWLSHLQTVSAPPPRAKVLASSRQDGCQIIRYSKQAFSVQFHPEFTAAVMDACLGANGRIPEQPAPRLGAGSDGQWALTLLQRFYQQCRNNRDGAAAA